MRKFFLAAIAAIALVCPAQAQLLPPAPGTYRTAAKSVTTAATRLDSGSFREYVYVWNNGTATLYIGFDSTVTTSTGWPVPAGSMLPLRIATTTTVYGIVASGTLDVRVLEVM